MVSIKKNSAGRPKSTEKQQQILDAATRLFLANGLTATSMDSVAKEANVSKQTVYSHYKNKDALFSAVIRCKVQEYQLDAEHIQAHLNNVEKALSLIGCQFVQLLHDPDVIAMYRIVIGEVSTNPHIAELFFEAGPMQALQVVVDCLLQQQQIPVSPERAVPLAMTYFNLLKGDHHMKSLMGLSFALSDKQQQDFVPHVLRQFMVILKAEQ